MNAKGQSRHDISVAKSTHGTHSNNFVLDKGIFSNIFDKDIRRVYFYKKAERLAKAIHLVTPAFVHSPALRDRLDIVAVGLIDAAIAPPQAAREKLSRELLALSSVLSIARTGGLLSDMNVELISREAQVLLQEVASYEEPRVFMEDAPTLAELAKDMPTANRSTQHSTSSDDTSRQETPPEGVHNKGQYIGQEPVAHERKGARKMSIISVLKTRGPSRIKDISTVIRDVSEKTIQRELQALVGEGVVSREGDRRWTTYTLVG